MNLGSQFVSIGLFVVFVALVFEYFSLQLSGLAVGFGLVITGLLVLVTRAASVERSSDPESSNP